MSRNAWIAAGVACLLIALVVAGYSWHAASVGAALAAAAEAHRRRVSAVQAELRAKDTERDLETRARIAALRVKVAENRRQADAEAFLRRTDDWPHRDSVSDKDET